MIDFADDDLESSFPACDGTAETAGTVVCPYCGAPNDITLDPGSGSRQEYVEDCQVCCQPWRVRVRYAHDGAASIVVEAEDQP